MDMKAVPNSSFWKDRPTLVTGATGFVGGRLAMKLVRCGARVVSLARGRVATSELVRSGVAEQVTLLRGDIRDRDMLESVLRRYEIDTVMHLAGQAIVSVALRDPLSTLEANVLGTWNLLEACRRAGSVKQVVTASSDKAYGTSQCLPYTEDTPLQGQHPYDTSKACADSIARAYASSYGLPVAVTRCANLFGGGDFNYDRIVPGTIRSVLRGEAPVIRSDGKFTRDFLYIEDGVDAYMALAEGLASRADLRGQAFNFSANQPTLMLDLVHHIIRLMQSTLEPVILDNASHELRAQHLCADKARELLRWSPRVSLEQGLIESIAWYREVAEAEDAEPRETQAAANWR
jgi:CDP-glucose 4,6-dehydratase